MPPSSFDSQGAETPAEFSQAPPSANNPTSTNQQPGQQSLYDSRRQDRNLPLHQLFVLGTSKILVQTAEPNKTPPSTKYFLKSCSDTPATNKPILLLKPLLLCLGLLGSLTQTQIQNLTGLLWCPSNTCQICSFS